MAVKKPDRATLISGGFNFSTNSERERHIASLSPERVARLVHAHLRRLNSSRAELEAHLANFPKVEIGTNGAESVEKSKVWGEKFAVLKRLCKIQTYQLRILQRDERQQRFRSSSSDGSSTPLPTDLTSASGFSTGRLESHEPMISRVVRPPADTSEVIDLSSAAGAHGASDSLARSCGEVAEHLQSSMSHADKYTAQEPNLGRGVAFSAQVVDSVLGAAGDCTSGASSGISSGGCTGGYTSGASSGISSVGYMKGSPSGAAPDPPLKSTPGLLLTAEK